MNLLFAVGWPRFLSVALPLVGTVTILLAAAALVCGLLARRAAAVRRLVWLTALSAALVAPGLSWLLPSWRILPRWSELSSTAALDRTPDSAAIADRGETAGTQLALAPRTSLAGDAIRSSSERTARAEGAAMAPRRGDERSWGPALLLSAWLAGTIAMLCQLIRSGWALRRLARRFPPLTEGPLYDTVRQMAAELRTRCPRLFAGGPDAMPIVWGIGRGHLRLPTGGTAIGRNKGPTVANSPWPPAMLRAVLVHEFGHLRRRDSLGLWIGNLARAVYWFNPLAWFALSQLRLEQERACDDDVLRDGQNSADYAEHLLSLSRCPGAAGGAPSWALAMAQRSRLERRIVSLLDSDRRRDGFSRGGAVAASAAIIAFAAFLSSLRAAEPEPQPLPPNATRKASPTQPNDIKQSSKPAQPSDPAKPSEPTPIVPEKIAPAQSDPAKEAGPPPAAALGEHNQRGPVVLGIDLTHEPSVRAPAELPDLYEPSSTPGIFQQRAGVFEMPLDEHTWLKYSLPAGKYYFEYRAARDKPETERTFGPFAGDPFDKLKLDKILEQQIRSEFTADAYYRVRLMLRLHDEKLTQLTVRLLEAGLENDKTAAAEGNLAESREILKKFSDEFTRHATDVQRAALAKAVESRAAAIDRLTISVPADQYQSVDPNSAGELAKIADAAFGKPVDGLRAALVLADNPLSLDAETKVKLVVENTTDQPIRFSCSGLLQGSRAEVIRADGTQVKVAQVWYSGVELLSRHVLGPHERWLAAEPSLVFREKASPTAGYAVSEAEAGVGRYRVKYTVSIGVGSHWERDRTDGLMHRISPARGEWRGTLTTGEIAAAVVNR
ncbi:MAG TPA: M56 family metallopeptidase [Pirellulales bacterium]|jgi:beta-lactamase regulating signal transducer with metallopeptidase domain|nr:M56 family metallopeptidase [Pirellulales bacterium]